MLSGVLTLLRPSAGLLSDMSTPLRRFVSAAKIDGRAGAVNGEALDSPPNCEASYLIVRQKAIVRQSPDAVYPVYIGNVVLTCLEVPAKLWKACGKRTFPLGAARGRRCEVEK